MWSLIKGILIATRPNAQHGSLQWRQNMAFSSLFSIDEAEEGTVTLLNWKAKNSCSNSLSTKICIAALSSSPLLSPVSPPARRAAGSDLSALMAYHIASSRLSRSDAPKRHDQSAPTFHPAMMMEEQGPAMLAFLLDWDTQPRSWG